MIIHRAAITGKPACGATYGRLSCSGAKVTCPACREPATVQSVRQAAIEAAARRFRTGNRN